MKKIFKSLILCLMIIPCAIFFVGCMKEDEPTTPPVSEPTNEVKVLFSEDGKTLYRFAPDNDETEYVVPDGVVNISIAAFENCDNLTKVVLPSSLVNIKEKAFYHCNNLTTVEINSDINIGEETFYCCVNLSNINTSKIIRYAESSFEECRSLTEVVIAKEVELLPERVFSCFYWTGLGTASNLTTITFETDSSLHTISDRAFLGCGKLTTINIPQSCDYIGNAAFRGSGLTHITIGKNITHIGDYAFFSSNLETANFETGRVEYDVSIGESVFASCDNLISVSNYPFEIVAKDLCLSCDKLESFSFEGHVSYVTIKEGAFSNCKLLTTFTIPSNIMGIESTAFILSDNLATIIIDSTEIANKLTTSTENGGLVLYANIIYIKTGLDTTNSTYLLENFTKQTTSDKTGYDKYVKNA